MVPSLRFNIIVTRHISVNLDDPVVIGICNPTRPVGGVDRYIQRTAKTGYGSVKSTLLADIVPVMDIPVQSYYPVARCICDPHNVPDRVGDN